MRFENTTALAARLFRGEPRPEQMIATLVVKTTHEVDANGRLSAPLPDGAPPEPTDTSNELGILPGEQVPYRRGVDVWVLGHARPERPCAAMTVELSVGDELRTLLVVGDRTWRRDGTPTEPMPFETMPITYSRAYGGRIVRDDVEAIHPLNPDGRGFAPTARSSAGLPLPNVEWPDDRVHVWSDRSEVAGWAALGATSPLQLSRAVRVEPSAPLGYRITRALFSCAHPRLVFTSVDPGTPVRLVGMGPQGALRFVVPNQRLRAVVELGRRSHRLDLRLDTIGVLADLGRVVLSHRCSFRYGLVKHQHRSVTLSREPSGKPS